MLVGIIQSNYIPWRGYFDFIDDVDLFIFHDDLLYTRDWRNRNYINVNGKAEWLSVPVNFRHRDGTTIDKTKISYESDWISGHLNKMTAVYGKAPFFKNYFSGYESHLRERWETISQLNRALIGWIMKCLDITTPLKMSHEYNPSGAKTERLIGILQRAGATHYLSGPAADCYLDKELFAKAGISLSYKQYSYQEYPQFGSAFLGNVTVLDLLFHTGPQARSYLKSALPFQTVVTR